MTVGPHGPHGGLHAITPPRNGPHAYKIPNANPDRNRDEAEHRAGSPDRPKPPRPPRGNPKNREDYLFGGPSFLVRWAPSVYSLGILAG